MYAIALFFRGALFLASREAALQDSLAQRARKCYGRSLELKARARFNPQGEEQPAFALERAFSAVSRANEFLARCARLS